MIKNIYWTLTITTFLANAPIAYSAGPSLLDASEESHLVQKRAGPTPPEEILETPPSSPSESGWSLSSCAEEDTLSSLLAFKELLENAPDLFQGASPTMGALPEAQPVEAEEGGFEIVLPHFLERVIDEAEANSVLPKERAGHLTIMMKDPLFQQALEHDYDVELLRQAFALPYEAFRHRMEGVDQEFPRLVTSLTTKPFLTEIYKVALSLPRETLKQRLDFMDHLRFNRPGILQANPSILVGCEETMIWSLLVRAHKLLFSDMSLENVQTLLETMLPLSPEEFSHRVEALDSLPLEGIPLRDRYPVLIKALDFSPAEIKERAAAIKVNQARFPLNNNNIFYEYLIEFNPLQIYAIGRHADHLFPKISTREDYERVFQELVGKTADEIDVVGRQYVNGKKSEPLSLVGGMKRALMYIVP